MFTFEELFCDPEAFLHLPIFQILSSIHFNQDLEFTPAYFKKLGECVDYQQVVCVVAKLAHEPTCLKKFIHSPDFTLPTNYEELQALIDARQAAEDRLSVAAPVVINDTPELEIIYENDVPAPDAAVIPDASDSAVPVKCSDEETSVCSDSNIFLPPIKLMVHPAPGLYAAKPTGKHSLPNKVYGRSSFPKRGSKLLKVSGKSRSVEVFESANENYKSIKRALITKTPGLKQVIPSRQALIDNTISDIAIYAPYHNSGWFAQRGIHHTNSILSWRSAHDDVVASHDRDFIRRASYKLCLLPTSYSPEHLEWAKAVCDYIVIGNSLRDFRHLWSMGSGHSNRERLKKGSIEHMLKVMRS